MWTKTAIKPVPFQVKMPLLQHEMMTMMNVIYCESHRRCALTHYACVTCCSDARLQEHTDFLAKESK